MELLINQVKNTNDAIVRAFNNKDIDKHTSYYANNAVVVTMEKSHVTDIAQIRNLNVKYMKEFEACSPASEHIAIDTAGNIALYTGTWHDGKNNTVPFAMVLQKNKDNGNWEVLIENCFAF